MSKELTMKRALGIGIVCIMAFSSGCVSMSRMDATFYHQAEEAGLDMGIGDIKDPLSAALLNVLPGIGNFYLATGTEQSSQILYGVFNLLTWPMSIAWGVPQAAIDAKTINRLETIYYYRFNPDGRIAFDAAIARNRLRAKFRHK